MPHARRQLRHTFARGRADIRERQARAAAGAAAGDVARWAEAGRVVGGAARRQRQEIERELGEVTRLLGLAERARRGRTRRASAAAATSVVVRVGGGTGGAERGRRRRGAAIARVLPLLCALTALGGAALGGGEGALYRGGEGVAAVGLVLGAVAVLGGAGEGHQRMGVPTSAAKGADGEEEHLE